MACRRLDAQEGPGTCARVEYDTTKFSTFEDFSRGRALARRTPEHLHRTHEQHMFTLKQCVLRMAKKSPDRYRGEELRFAWSINKDGRPVDLQIKPSRHAEALTPCMKATVAQFRYPRTRKDEREYVEIPLRLD